MKVCLFEMLINAVIHGNKNDPSKRVLVLYTVAGDRIRISVVDEGEGFDSSALESPLDQRNLDKNYGRGIFIVKQYADEVYFNEKGNRILIVKNHEGAAGAWK
jgi:serine/threonine-protein kinase RsbW